MAPPAPAGSRLWLPSHSGGPAVRLQAQNHAVPASAAVHFTGARPLPLWLPSQKGCFFDRPPAGEFVSIE